ncbi:MAG: acyltransferase [Candidatus Omnitrophica bacterium]|nr:acyltransferase [Candidatus Omnitrophota bacterium]
MRIMQLDILRAIAVLMVMGSHIPEFLFQKTTILTEGLSLWVHCGWTGVDLFFVISGFLVSGLLFREYIEYGKVDVLRFFIRRGLKIYPAFYFFLLLTSFYLLSIGYPLPERIQYYGEILYVQNYWTHIWEHTWSLAVEEHFYLFIGLFILLRTKFSRGKNPFRILIALTIGLSITCLYLRLLNASVPYGHLTHLFPTHLRVDSLLFGVLLSYLHHFKQDQFKNWVQKRACLIGIVSTFLIMTTWRWSLFHPFMNSFGLTFLYVGFGGILILLLYHFNFEEIKTNWLIKGLAQIGFYSYSIYLWHIIFARFFSYHTFIKTDNFLIFSLLCIVTYFSLSIIFGIFMSKAIEIPALKFRDKFFSSHSGTLKISKN